MAKSISALGTTGLPHTEKNRTVPSITALARRAASVFHAHKDREIEAFIRNRGGVMNDAVERELSRHLGRM